MESSNIQQDNLKFQMTDPIKRSQPKCDSQQRQITAPEFVGFFQYKITRQL